MFLQQAFLILERNNPNKPAPGTVPDTWRRLSSSRLLPTLHGLAQNEGSIANKWGHSAWKPWMNGKVSAHIPTQKPCLGNLTHHSGPNYNWTSEITNRSIFL
jgi:hypothetical protein